ncbi:MAG: zinc ribbon domain-containing protein [Gemmatimonadota bacterium]|nr:MAG: zinc ribbon domain-containing protein [Gemmatimonadota bacterium]
MELLAGVVVAVAALALVLEPLVRGVATGGAEQAAPDDLDFTDILESESPKVQALLALKEIEFDRATGKLSNEDYAELKARYAYAALQAIKTEESGSRGPVPEVGTGMTEDDPAEAAIRRARAKAAAACPTCGPRPESEAAFCSDCGRPLVAPEGPSRCASCGSTVPAGGRFCSNCGVEVGTPVHR